MLDPNANYNLWVAQKTVATNKDTMPQQVTDWTLGIPTPEVISLYRGGIDPVRAQAKFDTLEPMGFDGSHQVVDDLSLLHEDRYFQWAFQVISWKSKIGEGPGVRYTGWLSTTYIRLIPLSPMVRRRLMLSVEAGADEGGVILDCTKK